MPVTIRKDENRRLRPGEPQPIAGLIEIQPAFGLGPIISCICCSEQSDRQDNGYPPDDAAASTANGHRAGKGGVVL